MASRQATGTPQWLEDKLKEVLGWDDFVIQGVVGAIEAATEADEIQSIMENFIGADPTAQAIVSQYMADRSERRARSGQASSQEERKPGHGSEPSPSSSGFAAAAASASKVEIRERDPLPTPYIKKDTAPGIFEEKQSVKGTYKAVARPTIEFSEPSQSHIGVAELSRARDRNEAKDPGMGLGMNVRVNAARGGKKGKDWGSGKEAPRDDAGAADSARAGGGNDKSGGKRRGGGGKGEDLVVERRVLNCLECGRIFDLREVTADSIAFLRSGGKCTFCGAQVRLKYLSAEEAADGEGFRLDEATRAALAFKDRLVEYDRTAAKRTAVIDDQSDYYETDGNAWLTEDEKRLLREKMAEKQAEEERKRRTVTVSFDVLGRQVLVTEQDIVGPCQEDRAGEIEAAARATAQEAPQGGGSAAAHALEAAGLARGGQARVMANPDIPIPSPLFMGPSGGKEKELREESGGRGGGREGGKGRGRAKGRGRGRGGGGAGRVQSDNPFDKFAEVAAQNGAIEHLTRQLAPWRLG